MPQKIPVTTISYVIKCGLKELETFPSSKEEKAKAKARLAELRATDPENAKEQTLVPVLLPNVRHFPMLEDERFPRMINDYLEAADISRVEQKERWKRRHR